MGTVSHIRRAGGAMRKLTARDLDKAQERRTRQARAAYDAAFDRMERSREEPIQTDTSLRARVMRWVRAAFMAIIRSPL
jgi:hypothetical protein